MDTVGEGEGGMNGESSVDTYTLSCLKQMASGELLCNTGNPAGYSVMTQRWGGRRGGRLQREELSVYILYSIYMYVCMYSDG